jgi:electron transfer flavoprotein beta subunit
VVKEVADPRLPTLRGKQKAKRTDIPTWSADDLEVEESNLGLKGSPTRVVKIFRPSVARECEKIRPSDEAELAAACDRVVEFLQSKELV